VTRFTPWKVCLTLACLVLGLLALGSTMSSGQAPKETPASAWEYKTLFGVAHKENDDQMNELGSKGWTLDTVIEEPNNAVRFVFKRAKRLAAGEAKAEGDN
jgi:hypothetical protein